MTSAQWMNHAKRETSQCIWMQAGVVRKKFCQLAYDCPECRFDRVMARTAEENKRLRRTGREIKGKRAHIVSWKERLRELPMYSRPCVHYLKGRIPFKACTHDYHCGHCDFDQYFDERYSVSAVVNPVDYQEINGFKIPQGYYLHPGHTWLKVEEGASVRVGIDDFGLRLLGPLDRVIAPLIGKEVVQGRGDIKVYREEKQAKFLTPVSGVVTAINPRVREDGSQANKDPYSEGWVMTLHAYNLGRDIKKLMIHRESKDFIGGEVDRLYQVIESVAGPLSADGGDPGHDIYGGMPRLGWERLVRLFLNPRRKR